MPKLRRDGGSECPNWEERVALDTETEKMVALNAEIENMVALNAEIEKMVALNVEIEKMVALNAKTQKRRWLWMPKLRRDGDSKHPNWEDGGSKRRN